MLSTKSFSAYLSYLLLGILAWFSAQLFWQIITPTAVSSEALSTKPSASIPVHVIQLFGRANTGVVQANAGVPDAQVLQGWSLLGTVLDGEHSLALVQMGAGGLRWLKAGERLDNGLQVVSVSPNDIQLLTAQGVKSLSLFSKQTTLPLPTAVSAVPNANASLQVVRNNLKQNPMSAMKLMHMDPVWNNGQLSGLTLMPQAGQEALFNQLGLKSGDVLVGLNGEPVGSWMSKMADLPKILDASGARVNVLRAGTETEWTVNW